MYAKDGLVHWEKGFFNVDELIQRWHEVVTDDMVAALHTRIATHGNHNCTELCHPFPLDGSDLFRAKGEAPLVLMHNGIIPEKSWINFAQAGDSDTSAFVRRLTPILNNTLPDEGYRGLIKGYDPNSRFLIMNGDGEFVTIGNWIEEDGILFSNNHFQGKMSENDWRAYGVERGYSSYGYNHTYSSCDNASRSLFNMPTVKYMDDEEDDIDITDWSENDIFDLAEANGLVYVDEHDYDGELQGEVDDDTYYFILDQGGRYDSYNNSPYNVRVYEYDTDTEGFVEAKDVWYHYYEDPDQLNFDSLLEMC